MRATGENDANVSHQEIKRDNSDPIIRIRVDIHYKHITEHGLKSDRRTSTSNIASSQHPALEIIVT